MSLRSPLSRARGLGSAKHGVHHFWVQRVSAVALIPLALWFVFSVAMLAAKGGNYEAVRYWAAYPSVAVTLVLGVQVVIEDYVSSEGWKIATLLLSKLLHIVVAVAAIFAVLKVALA
jgi:succinate dehydrogenase / fumarate reductase, membrane anchor subunit